MNNFIFYKENSCPILRYTIYGERHSGTKLMQSIMHYNTNVELTWQYGWKHWFGFANKNTIINDQNTLFLCLVRNPYDWIRSFFLDAHHVPRENKSTIDKFMFNRWYSVKDYVLDNTEILEDRNFLSGEKYKNIFDMRSHKIYYLRQVLTALSQNVMIIQYEKLITNTNDIIKLIKKRLEQTHNNSENIFYIKPAKQYPYNPSILDSITSNIDWNFEHTINYYKNNI